MDIINDIKNAAGDVMAGDSIVDTVLGMTDLDEKAIAMFEEKVGAGKFAEYKAMLHDKKITKEEIMKVARDAGVPETMIAMIEKFM